MIPRAVQLQVTARTVLREAQTMLNKSSKTTRTNNRLQPVPQLREAHPDQVQTMVREAVVPEAVVPEAVVLEDAQLVTQVHHHPDQLDHLHPRLRAQADRAQETSSSRMRKSNRL